MDMCDSVHLTSWLTQQQRHSAPSNGASAGRLTSPLITKIRLYHTLVILLYGSEIWVILKPELNKLEFFQMCRLRQILRASLCDRLSNSAIHSQCHQQPSIEELFFGLAASAA